MVATSAHEEPAHYEAFDFKKCLHWKITNEMRCDDLSKEPNQCIAALNLANRQLYSWHKNMSADELDRMYREHPNKVVVVYSASAYDEKQKAGIGKFGVCNYTAGFTCLPNQDFPLRGTSYKKARSKGALTTSVCVAGCADAPAALHHRGYENMDRERNTEHEVAFGKFSKIWGRAR